MSRNPYNPAMDELDKLWQELMNKTIAQQQAKVNTYKALKKRKLPIPPDLKAEVEGGGK